MEVPLVYVLNRMGSRFFIKSNGVASAVHSTNCRLRPTSVPPYNGDHMMHEVGRFWMMKPDADLLRLLPASDLDNTEQQTEVVKR